MKRELLIMSVSDTFCRQEYLGKSFIDEICFAVDIINDILSENNKYLKVYFRKMFEL